MKRMHKRIKAAPDRVKNGDSWRGDSTTAERGYGARWQRERKQFLDDNPLCIMCKAQGIVTAANVVDHIVAHRGDQSLFWSHANWQALCATCHNQRKQRIESAARFNKVTRYVIK